MKEKFELSLDTRQILTLTFVGLIAVGGVFVLGVAVGKKLASEEKVSQPVDLLSQLDAKSQPALTYQEELTKDPPKPPPPVVKPAPAPAPEPVVAAPPPAPEPAPVPPKAEEAVPTRTADHDAGDLKEAIARTSAKPVEATPDGSWTLQLSAYQDKAEADRFASDLRGKGYAPYVVEARVTGKGTWYRVRMGRFPSKDAASRYLADFQRETSIQAFVTNAN